MNHVLRALSRPDQSHASGGEAHSRYNRQWWYVQRPVDKLGAEHFEFRTAKVAPLQDNEILIRHHYLSLMPGNRAWMQRDTYVPMLTTGQVMPGRAIGEVLESKDPDYKPGDVVETMLGWQEYVVAHASVLTRRDKSVPMNHLLGVLGSSALTAYFGLFDVGQPRAGETLVISAAAGGVGSIVAQLGKIAGCRVIGIAGGEEKCAWLRDAIGLDGVVDYKAGPIEEALKQLCPDGPDLFFDNTGGPILEAMLPVMKIGGRIVCCGNTAQYDSPMPEHGPKGIPITLIARDLRMRGVLLMNYLNRRGEAEAALWRWTAEGRLKPIYYIVDGLENAPTAMIGLMAGANRGVSLVRI
ncbi:NADP-dependent oxidoreductase [Bradyrhizobium sp. AUGA SZCCT0182]|uniref:NADP-dependent oxidoreductase n=1 Tax=Bradyrhizobium sp. AUGA SZCCT0182 TaxID=2807667 RepID=UPI001BA7356D|nr:NADP-dependent oxidoreductase [Bradyrhizobium sp. AUGA SZCCT0182]MBR1231799.1 NADP-dependent oxidoreductase [Bradyrhizobium sp. AUGA SZCCT0182]